MPSDHVPYLISGLTHAIDVLGEHAEGMEV